jgi:tRNA(Ile)-lysidine synthase
LAHGLDIAVHHVNHHARETADRDAQAVRDVCASLNVALTVHDVVVTPGPNFEERARIARRDVLPTGALTGHTMDDLAETVLINFLRGAGYAGLSAMVGSPTKPLLKVRRSDLAAFVEASGLTPVVDETNFDLSYLRNRIRHETLHQLNEISDRDLVPVLARQAQVAFELDSWLDELSSVDRESSLSAIDCRELREWPVARLRLWLRGHLSAADETGQLRTPSIAELDRAIAVIRGEVTACELSGGRRLARSGQHLALQVG